MRLNTINPIKVAALVLVTVLSIDESSAQTLFVDQASGTIDELVLPQYTQLPDNQVAQSFTPSLTAVGFVQLNEFIPVLPGNDQVTFVVNLREGAYNGPIVSSTTPIILTPDRIAIGTFYFPDNVPVTPGQRYFFEPVLLSSGFMDIGGKSPSSYAGGDMWNNGVQDMNADYWFREGIVGVVPEPGIIVLLLLGAGVVLSFKRRGRFWRAGSGSTSSSPSTPTEWRHISI